MSYDDDDDDNGKWALEARKQRASDTNVLIGAIVNLRKKDFDCCRGSGVLISLAGLDGKAIAAEFMVPAEQMEAIKALIITGIGDILQLRKHLRAAELRDIENILATFPQPKTGEVKLATQTEEQSNGGQRAKTKEANPAADHLRNK